MVTMHPEYRLYIFCPAFFATTFGVEQTLTNDVNRNTVQSASETCYYAKETSFFMTLPPSWLELKKQRHKLPQPFGMLLWLKNGSHKG